MAAADGRDEGGAEERYGRVLSPPGALRGAEAGMSKREGWNLLCLRR